MNKGRKHWKLYLIGVAATSFMFNPSVAVAFDKVVVIPLGGNGNEISTVTSNGQVWMDRNLGSARVAGSLSDSIAYGWLYQWGRPADGHESRTSPLVSSRSSTDVPGHGNFITTSSLLADWRNPQNDALWQPGTGINNPCPSGFRIPTKKEWEKEMTSWSSKDGKAAFASPLRLTAGGIRSTSGDIWSDGNYGSYWSSTEDSSGGSFVLEFDSGNAGMTTGSRGYGLSVRCIKE